MGRCRSDCLSRVGISRRGAIPWSCHAQLRAPPAVPAACPRRQGGAGERRRRRCSRWWSRRAGAAPLAGLLLVTAVRARALRSPLALRSPVVVASALARRTRCSARSRRSRRRAGGCGTRCRGRAAETSTRWRSRPTGIAVAIETKCAARRPVVSPVQPGGTRREVLGSDGLPGSER